MSHGDAAADAPLPSAVSIELGAFQVETVRSVTGPAIGAAPPGAGRQPDDPGRAGEITIVRGPDKSTAFTDWLTRCLVDRTDVPARQAVTVVHYAADRTPLRRFHLANAFPTSWETLRDEAGGGAAEESVTLEYEELTVSI
ncbi:phage tail protein [Streptomyces sp. YGL11-2]|uniref:phage tail protein n=1 Tax=Streptomyces sp. YGL11-2 TaxID=3414028 RepID=UPI003CF0B4FE